jgi:pimeloyl-ACP methyl ester carboxylesterase
MPAGDTALLAYSATGGLRLFSLWDTLHVSTFVPGSDGRLHVGDSGGPVVDFTAGGDSSGFAWPPGAINSRAARLHGYGYEVERFAVRAEGAVLAGTLFLPRGRTGPVPGAVIIHGSGASDRDNYWYMIFADALVRSGLAVLLPDKRGSGLSEGDWFTTGLAGFAEDAAAQVRTLRAHPAVADERVGVVGMSQGGRVAPMVAPLADVAFVVNISGAAVPLSDQLEHETRQDLKRDRLPGFLDFIVRPLSIWSVKQRRPDWWETNGRIDPLSAWAEVAVPALTLYGRDDELDNVPVRRSVERLDSLRLPNLEVRVFEDTGHGFFDRATGRVRPDVLGFMAEWVRRAVAGAGDSGGGLS